MDREMHRKQKGGTESLVVPFVLELWKKISLFEMPAEEEGQLVAPQPL